MFRLNSRMTRLSSRLALGKVRYHKLSSICSITYVYVCLLHPLISISKLALVQTHQVKKILEETYADRKFGVVEMSTKGDEVLDRALYKIGDKSLFTKELENALIDGKVDMVVHSLKDLPSTLPEGIVCYICISIVLILVLVILNQSSHL